MPNSPDEETDEPLIANDRNYYKVEKWTKDGSKVERMLRQQPRQGAGGLRRGYPPSATYPADHSAAVTRAGGVAEGGAVTATS
jgi:hypothetical protein